MIEFGQKFNIPAVVCLGFFDSMHLGHVALYRRARELAMGSDSKVLLFTFSNSHFDVIGKSTKQIYTFDERLTVYKNVGVDDVISAVFDKQFMATSGQNFLQNLFETVNVKAVVCGFDYTCGCDRLSADGVKKYCDEHGAKCSIVDAVKLNGVKVSSTLVRELLSNSDVESANKLLSQDYFFEGKVTHGKHVGSALGFPTANVSVGDRLLPLGVFKGYATVDGVRYGALVNVGYQPTFDGQKPTVEAHLVGFDGNLYGKRVHVALTQFLRKTVRFNSADELKNQLQKDLHKVKND